METICLTPFKMTGSSLEYTVPTTVTQRTGYGMFTHVRLSAVMDAAIHEDPGDRMKSRFPMV